MEQKDKKCQVKKMIRIAAIENSESGSIPEFAKNIGISYGRINRALKTGHVTPELAKELESKCKHGTIKKEVLCPEIFA